MKVLIVSDTHGQDENLEETVLREAPFDYLIHCGDVEGREIFIEALAECPCTIVAGNNDFFTDLPYEEEVTLEGHKILVTHGHHYFVSRDYDKLVENAQAKGCKIPLIFILKKRNSPSDSASKASGRSDTSSNTVSNMQEKKTLIIGGIACGICLCLASNFQQFGIKYTTVGKAGFITACYIVIVPVIGLFLGKKCTKFIWAAVAMALIGLYLLCITDGFSIGKGDLLVLVCAFLFSLHILVIDYFSPKVDGVKLSCIQFLTCGVLSGIPALLLEHPELSSILAAWQPILYAGVMSCGVAYTLQIIGQKNMNPTVASLILSLESCISVLAGWIILRQQLSTKEILGCVIMFAAIILAQLPQKQTE